MATQNSTPSPVILSVALLIALSTCSSAGVVFDALISYGVPAALAASWRLWCCEIIQLLPFLRSLHSARKKDATSTFFNEWKVTTSNLDMDPSLHYTTSEFLEQELQDESENLFLPRYISALPIMALSGMFLGIHFSSWVYSIEKTSLFHSLLWVSVGPLILNGGQWILVLFHPLLKLFIPLQPISRPSHLETLGVLIGLGGAVLILFDIGTPSSDLSSSVRQPTLEGDLAAFLGAFAVSMYLLIGGNLRTWIPLWMYTFPVIFFAIVTSMILAFLDPHSPATWAGLSKFSVFGFLNPKYIWLSLYLGAGPGICGHTLINGLLKYLTPLTVSTAMLSEPILGSILGYFLGMQDLPGLFSCVGGVILLVGLVLVVAGESGCTSLSDIWKSNILAIDIDAEDIHDISQGDEISSPFSPSKVNKSYGAIHMKREHSATGNAVL